MEQINAHKKGPIPPQDQAVHINKLSTILVHNFRVVSKNEQYCIRIELTPELICLAIQNNIEGALIVEYGSKQGAINFADMLSEMIDDKKQVERAGSLSEFSVKVMDEMLKSLSEMTRDMMGQGNSSLTHLVNQCIQEGVNQ